MKKIIMIALAVCAGMSLFGSPTNTANRQLHTVSIPRFPTYDATGFCSSTNRMAPVAKCVYGKLSDTAPITNAFSAAWCREKESEGFSVSVCVGARRIGGLPRILLFRDFTYDKEGRVVRVSGVYQEPKPDDK